MLGSGEGGSGERGNMVRQVATGDIGSGETVCDIRLPGGVGGRGETVLSR